VFAIDDRGSLQLCRCDFVIMSDHSLYLLHATHHVFCLHSYVDASSAHTAARHWAAARTRPCMANHTASHTSRPSSTSMYVCVPMWLQLNLDRCVIAHCTQPSTLSLKAPCRLSKQLPTHERRFLSLCMCSILPLS
jgi:hypothetical protein